MRSWREAILGELIPPTFRLTAVADPDGLLLEEQIANRLREARIDLLTVEDPVVFRFEYESVYRSRWDRGEALDRRLVVRTHASDLDVLPFDVLHAGHRVLVSLSDLFPRLNYRVVEALDRGDLDALYMAQSAVRASVLGENKTKDFVLKHVFKIAPDMVTEPSDLLGVLVDRHHRGHRVPLLLEHRLVQLLEVSGRFSGWPLEQIVPDRAAFFRFLQERWPYYLDRAAAERTHSARELPMPYGLEFSGPVDLPFTAVRSDIDTLFLDNILRPIAHREAEVLADEWVAVGLRIDAEADRVRRLDGLLEVLEPLPTPHAPTKEWFLWARRWADVRTLRPSISEPSDDLRRRLAELQARCDSAFLAWLLKRYAALYNQPQSMVHHIPRMLQRHKERTGRRIALIAVDGLALAQWLILRDCLQQQRPHFTFEEQSLFAWIPTITPVSRQAIFSGMMPQQFAGSIGTTAKEPDLWRAAWSDSADTGSITYGKVRGDESTFEGIEGIITPTKVQIVGLVVNKIDDIMHGAELGLAGMDGQVRLWGEQGYLARLLDLLFQHDYDVFLTSDHGNVEAVGCGRPTKEGSMAEVRGQRARVYPSEVLRSEIAHQIANAIEWPPDNGLPSNYWPLLADKRYAFVTEGHRTVGHGGACIEEVVVPFIAIQREGS
jgi:PglZ domain